MKTLIKETSKWALGDKYSDDGVLAELTIEDNRIILEQKELSLKLQAFSPATAVGHVWQYYYKLFLNRILHSRNYAYMSIKCNSSDAIEKITGNTIDNITWVSFQIAGLAEWLNINCIDYDIVSACFTEVPPIIIHDEEPHIEIEYRSSLFDNVTPFIGNPYRVVMEMIPYVIITYQSPADINKVKNDIKRICRFFSILIGRIENVSNIYFKTNSTEKYCFEYYGIDDLSHLLGSNAYIERPRIKYEVVKYRLIDLYN